MYTFFLDQVEVFPINADNFNLSFVADALDPNTQISETFLQFVKHGGDSVGFDLIEAHKLQGKYLESLSVEIRTADNVLLWEGFADLSNIDNSFACDFISLKLIDIHSSVKDRIKDLGFELLRSKGFITDADFVPVKVANINIPDGEAAMFASVALYSTLRELYDITFKIANPVTLLSGIAYGVAVVPTLVDLVKTIATNLVPNARFWNGVYFKTLFVSACNYLDLEFQSSIFETGSQQNYTFIPAKDTMPVSNVEDATDSGLPDMTFGQFVTFCEKYFNARAKIKDGVFIFERRDYFESSNSGIVIPELLPEQSGWRTNLAELGQTYVIDISRDMSDHTTINNTAGYLLQSYVDIPIANNKALSLKGAEVVNIEMSRGHRYNNASDFETEFVYLYNQISIAINSITNSLGINASLPVLESRIGALTVSDWRFSTNKIAIVNSNADLDFSNDATTSARYLYDNFHSINSLINNQWKIYDEIKLPICNTLDVLAIKDNNYIVDAEGRIAQVEANSRDSNGMHNIKYRVKDDFLPGTLTEEINELK